MNDACGVYLIENLETGFYYIGSSKNIGTRWKSHVYQANRRLVAGSHLHNAIRKYGPDKFKITCLLECDEHTLLESEQLFLNDHVGLPFCYNIAKDSVAPMRGRHITHSEQTKSTISTKLLGRKILWADKIKATIERQGLKKLTDEQVSVARGVYELYSVTSSSLAKYFGISPNYMRMLLNNLSLRRGCAPYYEFDRSILFHLKFVNAKLQPIDIKNIRTDRQSGKSLNELSSKYNVSISLISQISNRKIWNEPWL